MSVPHIIYRPKQYKLGVVVFPIFLVFDLVILFEAVRTGDWFAGIATIIAVLLIFRIATIKHSIETMNNGLLFNYYFLPERLIIWKSIRLVSTLYFPVSICIIEYQQGESHKIAFFGINRSNRHIPYKDKEADRLKKIIAKAARLIPNGTNMMGDENFAHPSNKHSEPPDV